MRPRARTCPRCGAAVPTSRKRPAAARDALAGIARAAARLCHAQDALIYLRDGDQARLAARHGAMSGATAMSAAPPVDRGWPGGQAMADGRTVHVRDLSAALNRGQWAALRSRPTSAKARSSTVLASPLMLDGRAAGVIVLRRRTVKAFSPRRSRCSEASPSRPPSRSTARA